MDVVRSADGTDIRVYDEGHGKPVLIIGPGSDDGTRATRLAALLARRFRVIRLHRRQYRTDLAGHGVVSIAAEVADVLAIVAAIGEPVLIYGHSSGAVVALEALAAAPESCTGAVLYEPPSVIGTPLGGANGELIARARAALAAGRPGRALRIFMREIVELPAWQSWLAGAYYGIVPRCRALVPGQLDDVDALDRLGVRLDTYAEITVPTVLLGGARSPAHFAARLAALDEAMPAAERRVLPRLDHSAEFKAPERLALIVEAHAARVGHGSR